MDPLTLAGGVISILLGLVNTFFWNKLKDQDDAVKDLEHRYTQSEKDINMAHTRIGVLAAEAATKVQLNETVEKVRNDINVAMDRQEIRQERREQHLKEQLDKIFAMIVEIAGK